MVDHQQGSVGPGDVGQDDVVELLNRPCVRAGLTLKHFPALDLAHRNHRTQTK